MPCIDQAATLWKGRIKVSASQIAVDVHGCDFFSEEWPVVLHSLLHASTKWKLLVARIFKVQARVSLCNSFTDSIDVISNPDTVFEAS